MTNDTDELIDAFNEKHSSVTKESQMIQLMEEVGELAEEINTDSHDSSVIMEVADVCFVARSLALLHDDIAPGQVDSMLDATSEYNLHKSTDTEGSKVTDDA